MSPPACFPDPMILFDMGMRNGTRVFRMDHHFRYASSLGIVTVPTGFITDGASIPHAFWSLMDPWGPWFPAALVHDFLYSKSSNRSFRVDRATADLIFKEAMFNIGVDWLRREVIYRSVRMFGASSFKPKGS